MEKLNFLPVDRSRGPWGTVPGALLEDPRLTPTASYVGAWLSTRPANWVLRYAHVMQVLRIGRDAWLSARKQLIEAGYLEFSQLRAGGGSFDDVTYRFDPHGRFLTGLTEVGFADSGGTASGVTGVGEADRLPEPVSTRPISTRPPPRAARARAHAPVGGGGQGKDGKPVRTALAPVGAGLGARLADLLTEPERERADTASAGARDEQLQRAEAAVRAAVAAGTARSVPSLALSLGRKAARGGVGEVAAPAPEAGVAKPDPWPARESRAGSSVAHRNGLLIVEPGARHFRHAGGARDGQIIGGADAVAVWRRIDAGELPLQPPTSS